MIIYTNPPRKERYIPYYHLYVLLLEDEKYYVGISRNVKKRFLAHQTGQGAEWTKIHKPIKIIDDIQLAFCSYKKVKPYEDGKTIELMKKYGRENVRGGIYCAVDQRVVDSLLGQSLCIEINWLAAKNKAEKEEKKARKLKNDERRLAKKLNITAKNKGKFEEKKISSPKDEIVSGKAYTIVHRAGKKIIMTTNHCRVCGAKGAELRAGICAKCFAGKTDEKK
ncbi:MAG: hypothetical protein J6M27_11155 [Lachnospiraceae bacterium]|nr:hypothetical protein [Lachnospiraceae bacterium]